MMLIGDHCVAKRSSDVSRRVRPGGIFSTSLAAREKRLSMAFFFFRDLRARDISDSKLDEVCEVDGGLFSGCKVGSGMKGVG
jgi:hypothetical protein